MQLAYNNRFKPQSSNLTYKLRRNYKKIGSVIGLLLISIFLILKFTSNGTTSYKNKQYGKYFGYSAKDVPNKSVLIFPSIEHAPFLRELTVDNLFKMTTDSNGKKKYVIEDIIDNEDSKSKSESNEEANQMQNIKKSFLNHGKQVFSGQRSPEIVIVTSIDFEKYELSHLTKIVQNRVNYAQKKKYGLFIRWVQEFLPMTQDAPTDKKWVRLFLIRSAMYAFPKAKFFWYLDEDALIMRYDIDLYKYLLDPGVLDPIMLRDQPIIPPNGIIHTFKNTQAENVELIITQADQDLNLDSFIVKNEFFGKSLLEFWTDKLFRSYHNFPRFGESALTHILQWHPIYLARSTIVPPRTIASLHSALPLSEGGDDIHYSEGDFVVDLRDCDVRESCGQEIDMYWAKLEKANN